MASVTSTWVEGRPRAPRGSRRRIAAIGIPNPTHVRPDVEGSYLIVSGSAAVLAGLEAVPCPFTDDGDHGLGRNTLTQLSENLRAPT